MSPATQAPLKANPLYFSPISPSHKPPAGKEGYGQYMLTVSWSRVSGWGQPKISPRADLTFDPLAGVLQ
jgi:branched-chain amino acid aminotransferase